MDKLKKAFKLIFDIIEVHLPTAFFAFVFFTYAIMIAYRYIFHAQMGWLFELNTIAFLWCGTLAASYGSRMDKHIVFAIIYDKLSQKVKLVFRFIVDILIIAAFIILIPSSLKSIDFYKIMEADLNNIPMNIVFSPFIVFIVLTIIHHIVSLYKDIMLAINLLKGRGPKQQGSEDEQGEVTL